VLKTQIYVTRPAQL